jgi:phage gpG-like protein
VASSTRIIGLPAMRAALAAKAAVLKAVAAASVELEVRAIKSDAVGGAPLGETGDLKGSIEGESHGTSGEVKAAIRYAPFVEFGTSKMGARPYMGPASDRSRARFVGRTSAALRKAL